MEHSKIASDNVSLNSIASIHRPSCWLALNKKHDADIVPADDGRRVQGFKRHKRLLIRHPHHVSKKPDQDSRRMNHTTAFNSILGFIPNDRWIKRSTDAGWFPFGQKESDQGLVEMSEEGSLGDQPNVPFQETLDSNELILKEINVYPLCVTFYKGTFEWTNAHTLFLYAPCCENKCLRGGFLMKK